MLANFAVIYSLWIKSIPFSKKNWKRSEHACFLYGSAHTPTQHGNLVTVRIAENLALAFSAGSHMLLLFLFCSSEKKEKERQPPLKVCASDEWYKDRKKHSNLKLHLLHMSTTRLKMPNKINKTVYLYCKFQVHVFTWIFAVTFEERKKEKQKKKT